MREAENTFFTEIFPFWERLSPPEQKQIAGNARPMRYQKGERVHSGPDGCTGVIAVRSGTLRAYLLSEEGKEITLYRLIEGDVCLLSAACILKNISFGITLDAETDTEILLVSPAAYEAVSRTNPEVEKFISDTVAARFSDAMWVMEQIVFMKFDRRLAIFLLDEAALEQSDTISLTHDQIARHLGTAREVVTRMLKYFQSEGLLSVSRGGIRLLDRKGVNAIAQASV